MLKELNLSISVTDLVQLGVLFTMNTQRSQALVNNVVPHQACFYNFFFQVRFSHFRILKGVKCT